MLVHAIRNALSLLHPDGRLVYCGPARTHVEMRSLPKREREYFRKALEEALSHHPSVHWVRLNHALERVVISHDTGYEDPERLVELVEAVERDLGLAERPFGQQRFVHPGDDAHLGRAAVIAAANVAVLGVTLVRPRSARSNRRVELGVASALMHNIPGLRASLERRFGHASAELTLGVVTAGIRAINISPSGAFKTLAYQGARIYEARARMEAWNAWEADLCSDPESHEVEIPTVEDRPRLLPRGALESYTDVATMTALGSFVVSLAMGRPLSRAAGFLYGGIPRPAFMGRSAFEVTLARRIAKKGGLVLRHEALHVLDRVDCVVIDSHLLAGAGEAIESVEVLDDGIDPVRATELAYALFDPSNPDLSGRRDEFSLVVEQSRADEGGRECTLRQGGDRVARVRTQAIPTAAADVLLSAIKKAGHRISVIGPGGVLPDGISVRRFEAPTDVDVGDAVRTLQSEGRVVMYIGAGPSSGVSAADFAIDCRVPATQPAWHADVIVRPDLAVATMLVRATLAARSLTTRVVRVAQAEVGASTLISWTSPPGVGASRAFLANNLATMGAFVDGLVTANRLKVPKIDRVEAMMPWHSLAVEDVLDRLATSESGLTQREAMARLPQSVDAPHELEELLELMGEELNNPMTPVLAGGAALAGVLASWADTALLGSVLFFDAAWSARMRQRARRAFEELNDWSTLRTTTYRDGEARQLAPHELVRGDVVVLRAGDVVPADARIIACEGLEADESSLTGESVPVSKRADSVRAVAITDRRSMLYLGTSVASGWAKAVITAIDADTESGRLEVEAERNRRHKSDGLDARLRELAWITIPAAGVASVAVMASGLLRGRDPSELFATGVSLAVAAIPEGLTLLSTVAELAAAQRLRGRGVQVRNHRAIEALGRLDVVCLDKTGTLTEGMVKLTEIADLTRIVPVAKQDDWTREILRAAVTATATPDGDHGLSLVTDRAIQDAASVRDIVAVHSDKALPFSTERSYHAVVVDVEDRKGEFDGHLYVKGAPEVLIERSAHDNETRDAWLEQAEKMSERGLRVLAVAHRPGSPVRGRLHDEDVDELEVLGLLGLADPPREGTREAIGALRRAGVRTVMITGDHVSTALNIAERIDMEGAHVLTGAELDDLSDQELRERVDSVDVFARVTPRQKTRIVTALQAAGRVVAMTGDGANDAPAIRLADVGIAVSSQASSAARNASDIVIDGQVEALIHAIAEGRATWAAVRDASAILVGGNLGEIGFTAAAGIVSGRSPLNARQLLLVNLFTDALPALAMASREDPRLVGADAGDDIPIEARTEGFERAVAWRALITSAAATSAWTAARLTLHTRGRAGTVGLVSVVGAQLGQTLIEARGDRRVILASVGSMAVLLGIVQVPGVSQLLGCRPLGPLGLAQAGLATGAAAGSAWALRNAPESVQAFPDRAMSFVRAHTADLRARAFEFVGANEEEAAEQPQEGVLATRVRGLARDVGRRITSLRVVASQRATP